MLTVKDYKKVSEALIGVASKWKWIGLSLGLSEYTLQNIKQTYHTPEQRMGGMVKEWLAQAGSDTSWEKLIVVLRSDVVAENRLAHELESRYCSGSTSSTSASSSDGSSARGGKRQQSGNGKVMVF